jgi:hypothetical protein
MSPGVTLLPSVWRDSGCKSHFIVWHDTILWCDWHIEAEMEPENLTPELDGRVFEVLNDQFVPFAELAQQLNVIPWEVARVCRILKARGLAEEDSHARFGHYRRVRTTPKLREPRGEGAANGTNCETSHPSGRFG